MRVLLDTNVVVDRLLIAQAHVEGVPIVTADRSFARYDVEVIAAR